MFKSTLIVEFNGNPFLSKDRLTQVRNSVYFNNTNDYISAANSENTCLLRLGLDCAMYFVTNNVGDNRLLHGLQRKGACLKELEHLLVSALEPPSDLGSWGGFKKLGEWWA